MSNFILNRSQAKKNIIKAFFYQLNLYTIM